MDRHDSEDPGGAWVIGTLFFIIWSIHYIWG